MMEKSIYKIFIAAIILFLIFIIPMVLFTPVHTESTPVHTKSNMSIDTETPTIIHRECMITGLTVQFRDEITELEVRKILENYSLPTDKLDYNVYGMSDRYYIKVDKDKIRDVKDELRESENWTAPTPAIEKGNYYIIIISEQATHNNNFIKILNKYHLQVKTFIWCHVSFPWGGISQEHANELERELKMNENIFSVTFESIVE